ncbi:PIN domain-like protein [Trametes gibbosa]|nr:PIN domain-like protein [Trametes gibbosa]
MQQLQQTFTKGHAQAGENPKLWAFFYHLAMLSERPIHLIFVTDGALRPAIKRKKHVKTTPHWLMEGMRSFAIAFGYSWLKAAGEAEAELAKLNKLGIIDAVLTEDSNALLFGAQVVIRNYKRTDPDIVKVYRANILCKDKHIVREDIVLLALLLGSDYDPTGLPRCGPAIARRLIQYDLGKLLCAGMRSHSDEDLASFLSQWRLQLCERLRVDPNGFIGRQHAALANAVPATFPDVDVLCRLISPALLTPELYSTLDNPRDMDVAQLGQLCELYFTWGSRIEIMKTFRTALFPGEAIRMLVNEGLGRCGTPTKVKVSPSVLLVVHHAQSDCITDTCTT